MLSSVFWGAAIVFFLAKFINFHNSNTQGFWVEVSSQVENGLFTLTGIGLIPVRAIDTYREPTCHPPTAIRLDRSRRHVQNMGLQAAHKEAAGKSWSTSVVRHRRSTGPRI
jgi:hypothetical protein